MKADLGGKCERIVTHNDRAEERVKLYTFAVESLVRCGKKKKKPLWILEKYLSAMYFDLYYLQYILQTVLCFQDHPLLLSHPPIVTLDPPNP